MEILLESEDDRRRIVHASVHVQGVRTARRTTNALKAFRPLTHEKTLLSSSVQGSVFADSVTILRFDTAKLDCCELLLHTQFLAIVDVERPRAHVSVAHDLLLWRHARHVWEGHGKEVRLLNSRLCAVGQVE
jgi:hypothetical protein